MGDAEYAERLVSLQGARWKQLLDVQRPYRKVLDKYCAGRVLEIGCGTGRNLRNLQGRGVGIDVNEDAVQICHDQGLTAYTPHTFAGSADDLPGTYDALLLSHLLEHVTVEMGDALIRDHLRYLKPGGTVLTICPQERGFGSDDTHIRWVDFDGLESHRKSVGLDSVKSFSFPFPRAFGRLFIYNEFIHVMRAPVIG
jgi:SAM-dependent methyltransferase